MVFKELGARFAQKIKTLQAETQSGATLVSASASAVKAAQDEVEASTPSKRAKPREPFYSPKAKGSPEAEAEKASSQRQPWPAKLLKEDKVAEAAAEEGAADDEEEDDAAAMEEEEGVAVAME